MGGILTIRQRSLIRETGQRIACLGFLCWAACLPFAMAQRIRFTSVFLFTILGGYLITRIFSGPVSLKLPFRQLGFFLPLMLLSLLPLLHFLPSGFNQRELVLGAPLFIMPILFFQMKDDFPVWFSRMLLLLLLLSYAALLVFLLLQGPSTVWRSVRSEVEIPDLFLLARPQLGLLTGMVYFFMMHCMIPEGRLLIRILTFLFFSLILFWILAKIAFLGFLLVHIFWVIFSFRRKPLVWFFLSFLLVLSLISLVFTLQNSGLMEEALSRDGLSFKKYPKALVNSINSRVVLWKASAGLLSENHNFLAGLPSEILEKELQQFTARYNAYLAGRNLNPHNQFLYLMLHYGIAGLLIFLSLWFFLLRQTKNSPALISAVLFFFICGQTEIFIDREFGIQLYLLFFLLILLLPRGPSNLSIRQA